MAGESSRFFKNGFKMPKYKLKLNNKTILENILLGFQDYFKCEKFIFGLNPKFNDVIFVKSVCEKIGIQSYKVIELKSTTRGQAETVNIILSNIKNLDESDEIYIFNIDTIHLNFKKQDLNQMKCSGYLELFIGEGNQWSFAKIEENNNKIIKVKEKDRISKYCSNGLYCFLNAKIFKHYFNIYQHLTEKELYIAPMYNLLIEDKLTIKGIILTKNNFIFCGTPQEYKILNKHHVSL